MPTSQDLIQAALEAGEIDYETSLIYRAYALFEDPGLPLQFGGGGTEREDLGLFLETELSWAKLSDTAKSALEPFLVRPDDARSIFAPATVSAASVAAVLLAPERASLNAGRPGSGVHHPRAMSS